MAGSLLGQTVEGVPSFRRPQLLSGVGAVVGGYLFSALGSTGITGFNIWSMIVATIGAIIVLWLYHAIAAR